MSRERELQRNLRACVADGAAFSTMVGIGETYIPAFVIALGLGQVTAGLVATIPVLAGGFLQLLTPVLLRRLPSPRWFVAGAAAIQGAAFLPLIVLAIRGEASTWAVFLPVTLYWAFGMAGGPAWNQWVEKLFPRSIRPNFFARRSRLNQFALLAGLIAAGLTLQYAPPGQATLLAFAVLFGIAATCRFLSAAFLAMQSPTPTSELHIEATPSGWRHWSTEVRQLVAYLLLVQVAVYVSGPYFNPYMLAKLELNYGTYMFLLCCGFGGKILAFPLAGRLAKRFGAHRLLWIGGAAIVPIAGLWTLGDAWWYLACCQIISGITWACFELGMFLMFLDSIPKAQRVGVLTWYNLGNAAAMVLGSLIGATILQVSGGSVEAYLWVFLVSSCGRLLAIAAMPGRPAAQISRWGLERVRSAELVRWFSIRPGVGGLDRPLVAPISSVKAAPATSPLCAVPAIEEERRLEVEAKLSA